MGQPGFSRWTVLPHEPIEQLEENLWRVVGTIPKMALPRQMVIARTTDGRLVIHNAVALDDGSMTQLESFGTPTWMIVPSAYHRLDAFSFKQRYPKLQVLAPRGAAKKVAEAVPVDATFDAAPTMPGLKVYHWRGAAEREGVLEVRSERGVTIVENDIIFNQPHLPGAFGTVYKMLGQSGRPKVTIIARLALVKDKRELAAHMRELGARDDVRRLVPAHIDPIDDAAPTLRELADTVARA